MKGRRSARMRRGAAMIALLALAVLLSAGALQPAQAGGSTELAGVFAKVAAVSHRRVAGPVAPAVHSLAAQQPEPGYWDRTPLPLTGLATFYAEGLMDYVRDYRLGLGQVADCPECVGAAALLRAGDIGRKVWLQAAGEEPVGPFLVVDCARREDFPLLSDRGWAVDVSYELGRLWGMAAPLGGVTVLEDPADVAAGPRQPPSALTPFAVPPGEAVITAPTATPAVTSAVPTPWPTRLPVARAGAAPAPASALPTATPFWPPPLTPIITTPTPAVTPPGAAGTPEPTLPAEGAVARATETPLPEVALGRAGAGLLGQPTVAAPLVLELPTVTPSPPARTPRPGLPPILPDLAEATPTPTPTSPSLLEQIWQALLELVQP